MNARACRQTDLVGSRLGWFVWCLPTVLFLAGIGWGAARPWLWIPSLAIAGSACLANATRCGRLHCFATGPLFLLGAVATLLDAFGVVAIDWRLILGAVALGTAVSYAFEWVRGKYLGAQLARSRCL
jgi:hypothetical protein